ncbi:hypothetical protein WDW86_15300 [Bdellovibrionota bacterium FG-2]
MPKTGGKAKKPKPRKSLLADLDLDSEMVDFSGGAFGEKFRPDAFETNRQQIASIPPANREQSQVADRSFRIETAQNGIPQSENAQTDPTLRENSTERQQIAALIEASLAGKDLDGDGPITLLDANGADLPLANPNGSRISPFTSPPSDFFSELQTLLVLPTS